MEPKVIVGAIVCLIYLAFLLMSVAGIWKRGIGAKIYLFLITSAVAIALSIAWHRPEDDILSIALGIVFTASLGLTAALLGWVAFASLGIIGDGGFVSELTRSLEADSDYQTQSKLPDMELEVGNLLTFGRLNGKECGEINGSPIHWRVLDVQDNKALLIAEQYVGRKVYQYDAGNVGVTSAHPWVGANDLRAWLNDDFLKSAFNGDERARLALSEDNDYVSCLSIDEAMRYYGSDSERRIDYVYEQYQTQLEHAKKEREDIESGDELLGKLKAVKKKKDLEQVISHLNEWDGWWLRPTGSMMLQKHIPYVMADGSINHNGIHAARSLYIRPTIWIITKLK